MNIKKTVLIADDNPDVIRVLSEFLRTEGYHIRVAINGNQVIRSALASLPDLILLDIQMPVMDGYETCKRLKSIPKTSRVPVIFMSAMSEMFNKEKAFESGGVDYIVKPMDYREVLARVNAHSNIYRYEQQILHEKKLISKQFAVTFEQAAVGIVQIQLDTFEIVKANRKVTAMLSISLDDIINTKFPGLAQEIYVKNIHKSLKALQTMKSESFVMEFCLNDHSQSTNWLKVTASMVYDIMGRPDFILGILEDVSEKKAAELGLLELNRELESRVEHRTKELENEKRFAETVINSLPGIFYVLDSDGHMKRCNDNFKAAFGLNDRELENFNLNGFNNSDMDTQMAEVMRIVQDKGHASSEVYLPDKSGKEIPYFITGSWLAMDENEFMIGIGIDISERKTAEEQIRILSQALEQSPVSVMITNDKGSILYVNHAFTDMTGYTFEEVLGKNPSILQSNKTDSKLYKQLWKTIKNGQTWKGELINKRKDGVLIWESASVSPITDENNNIIRFMGVNEDISDRKKMEDALKRAKNDAEAAAQAKSDFLANMSHEIRTPLNAIIGLSSLSLGLKLDEKQRDYISKINLSGRNLLRIVNEILDYSKIEAGKLELESVPFKLEDIKTYVSSSMQIRAKEKKLNYFFNIDRDVPIKLRVIHSG